MSDRLQFFREQMAAFEGTSDPQEAIKKGYFVQQPRHSLANNIANRIALRPSSKHLLVGGIGSGKTTQLMIARDRINEIDDTHAIYVDASLYTDISEIKPGALIAIIGLVLCDKAAHIENESIADLKSFVENEAYGYYDNALERAMISGQNYYAGILNKHLEKRKERLNRKKWIEILESLYKIVREEFGSIIIIFDGLDRLSNIRAFYDLLDRDIEIINELGIGLIIVGSLEFSYSNFRISAERIFDYYYNQPCFDVEEDSESFKFFCKILLARTKHDFISASASDLLITNSGGVLRDLINLTQASIEEAYLADRNDVDINCVETAINLLGKSKILGASDYELEKVLKEYFG